MKKTSKLDGLPAADQKHILELCAKQTYPEVVKILAKPRAEGGLDLQTSKSALSRFNLKNGFLAANCDMLVQSLEILKEKSSDLNEFGETFNLLEPLTFMMGQVVFRQFLQNQPWEVYKQPLLTYFRFQRLLFENKRLHHTEQMAARRFNRRQPVPFAQREPTPARTKNRQPAQSTTTTPPKTASSKPSNPNPIVKQTNPTNPRPLPKLSEVKSLEELDALEETLKTASPADLAVIACEYLGMEIPPNLAPLINQPPPNNPPNPGNPTKSQDVTAPAERNDESISRRLVVLKTDLRLHRFWTIRTSANRRESSGPNMSRNLTMSTLH